MSEEILKLIEAVDPSDTPKLDEIDCAVWFIITHGSLPETPIPVLRNFKESPWGLDKYTRSRDALKSIRPEGWSFQGARQADDGTFWAELRKGYQTSYEVAKVSKCKTEELAELHVIIQAIQWERNQ